MIFTTLDRYIIRKFLLTFLLSIILFSTIAVVIDLTEKIDDFIEKSIPLREIIFGYYVNFIPYIDALLTPLFIFISVVFFTSRMAYRSEIISILSSGVSFYRMLVAYLFAAALLAGMLLYANHFLIPDTNKKRLAFEFTYISNPYRGLDQHIYLQIERDKYVYMQNFRPKENTAFQFSYEVIRNGKLRYKLRADQAEWKESTKQWRLKKYYARSFGEHEEKITKGALLDTTFNFTPEDIVQRVSTKEEMTTPQLKQYIAALQLRGAENIEFYLVELYRRTSDAVTIFILTLIGVAMSSRRVRGGSGLHIAMGVALSASFIIFTRFATTFSTNGSLSPFVSVWLANVIYGALAVWLIVKAPK